MADDKKPVQTVTVPGVGDVDFPADMTDAQISDAIKNHYLGNPAVAHKATATIKSAPHPLSLPWMKEKFYNAVETATNLLPAAGATAGAILGGATGSGVPLAGTIAAGGAGAAIGGAGGESAKQIIQRWLGYDNAPQTSSEAAERIGKEGVTQGAIELATSGAGRLAPVLKKAAVGQYERALAPTTKFNKAITQEITPELIARGEHGSMEQLQKRAEEKLAGLNPELNQEYSTLQASSPKLPTRNPLTGKMQAGVTGQIPNSGTKIISDLEALKKTYMPGGIVAQPQAVQAIEGVQKIVAKYGKNISPDNLRRLRQIFEEVPAQKGAYVGADISTNYALRAQQKAADSIRGILNGTATDIGKLNREISFWLDVKRVTSESGLRQTGQQGGLSRVLSPLAAGAAASTTGIHFGATAGLEAGAGTALTAIAYQAMRSPQWRTASAVMKDRFANALASGNVREATAALARLGIATPELMQSHQRRESSSTGESPE